MEKEGKLRFWNLENTKMKLNKILAGLLFVLALAFPHAVLAEDFTFNVEVDLTNLHEDVTEIMVVCQVFEESPPFAISEFGNLGGGFSKIKAPKSGELKTTVPIKFDVFSSDNPADANFYKCFLRLFVGKEFSNSGIPDQRSSCATLDDPLCAFLDKPFSVSLVGSIR